MKTIEEQGSSSKSSNVRVHKNLSIAIAEGAAAAHALRSPAVAATTTLHVVEGASSSCRIGAVVSSQQIGCYDT